MFNLKSTILLHENERSPFDYVSQNWCTGTSQSLNRGTRHCWPTGPKNCALVDFSALFVSTSKRPWFRQLWRNMRQKRLSHSQTHRSCLPSSQTHIHTYLDHNIKLIQGASQPKENMFQDDAGHQFAAIHTTSFTIRFPNGGMGVTEPGMAECGDTWRSWCKFGIYFQRLKATSS